MSPTHKLLHVVTGPLAAGKSTYIRKLAEELGTEAVGEYQLGVDISEDLWWEDLEYYAETHDTIIVEVHFEHKGRDACDYERKKTLPTEPPHFKPPKHVKIYWIIPETKQLFKQQKSRDRCTFKKASVFDIQYYEVLKKKLS